MVQAGPRPSDDQAPMPPASLDGPVTSRTVARLAGVSQSTVSRVLNGSPGVNEQVRRRVRAVVEDYGYRPNPAARSLITRRTRMVGVLTSDLTNFYYPALLDQLEATLRQNGYRLLLVGTDLDAVGDSEAVEMLLEHGVDGVVIASPRRESPAVAELVRRRFPVVLVNRYVDGVEADWVVAQNAEGSRAAVELLLDLGHRRIAYIAGLRDSTTDRDRRLGYDQALASAGIIASDMPTARGNFSFDSGVESMQTLLGGDPPPTAVLCANDMMALGALHCVIERGLAVPADISIVGFDDVAIAGARFVNLTTVGQPIGEMARRAAELLLRRIEDPAAPIVQHATPTTLMVRGTTGAPGLRPGEGRADVTV